jgi:pimeloyl-ACP methyl ester carboxylesterase
MKYNRILTFLLLIFPFFVQGQKIKHVYLLHGLAADSRLFSQLRLDSFYQIHPINLPVPERKETMKTYAQRIANQIDTSESFALIGVSFGGMVSTELAEIIPAKKVILIASAGCRNELPKRYLRMKKFPIYKIVPGFFMKWSSFLVQPLAENDRYKQRKTFNKMLLDKNPRFLKQATRLIMTWERTEKPPQLYHIHGTRDHTIPYKNVKADVTIPNGSHFMVLTEGEKMSKILNDYLGK